MPQTFSRWVASGAWIAYVVLSVSSAHAASADPIPNWTAEVHSCFVRALDDARRISGEARSRYGVEAEEIFLAEQIVSHLESKPNQIGDSQAFCKEKVTLFLSSSTNAIQDFHGRKDGTLAKLGSAPIANSPFLVATYQNLIGRHYRGHSDITDTALSSLAGLSNDARSVIVAASQSPDLYRWGDDRFHAQTADYSPNDLRQKIHQVAASQKRFLDLLARLISLVRERAGAGDIEVALGAMGIAAHLMQDLTYHRGMTLTQHAGLSYVLKADPDQPKPPADLQLYDEAVKNTGWLLNITLRQLDSNLKTRLLQWSPQGGFSYEKLITRIYSQDGGSSQQDISTTSLIAYYELAKEYSSGRRPLQELASDSCAASPGLACWSIQEIKSTIEAKFP